MNAVHVMPPLKSQQETVAIAIVFLGNLGKFQLSFYEVVSRRNFFVVGLLSKPVFSVHAGIASAVEAGLCAEVVKLADQIVRRIRELSSMQTQATVFTENMLQAKELLAEAARINQESELELKRLKTRKRVSWWAASAYWLICAVGIFLSLFI